jgi:4-hydroxymandelate oxidase
VPLPVDGWIRRGEDVLIALASGADAGMIGRPVIHGVAGAGARGVSHVIRVLRDELEAALALSGVRTLTEIDPHINAAP